MTVFVFIVYLKKYLNLRYFEVACGVTQGPILGLLLFNIKICDMFFEKYQSDTVSQANDNILHTYHSDLYNVLSKLKKCTENLFIWFKENHMKPNSAKCHLLVTTEKSVSINIDRNNVTNKKEQKLLGIKFELSLSFKDHITSLCKKDRIVNYMDLPLRRVLMKAFITSQFSYGPLAWMLHSRTLNNCINNIHKRALRLTYKDSQSFINSF